MTLVSLIFLSLDKTIFVPLQVIEIYFDTGTYDNIERDVKVTINAQLGLIGGTMGLLTGFSILSALEIIYYIGRFLLSVKLFKPSTATKSKEEKPNRKNAWWYKFRYTSYTLKKLNCTMVALSFIICWKHNQVSDFSALQSTLYLSI